MSEASPISDEEALPLALARFPGMAGAACERLGTGLLNRTFRARAPHGDFVLQRVNPIFDPRIHENIVAVTRRLAERGVPTPLLLPADDGRFLVELGPAGRWRLMTLVEGDSRDTVGGPADAEEAGALVARFHAALDGLDHTFVGLRLGVHDTARHLATLEAALSRHGDHRLFSRALPMARRILDGARALAPLPDLPPRVSHGDLKFSNLVFRQGRAVALVDLDTVAPMSLGFEVGDAWRSWCNPRGEDVPEAVFDLGIFAASARGYLGGLGRALSDAERAALLGGLEWVSLELSARFLADALDERYFGWDATRFATRGEHNLVRAAGQLSLHHLVVSQREARRLELSRR